MTHLAYGPPDTTRPENPITLEQAESQVQALRDQGMELVASYTGPMTSEQAAKYGVEWPQPKGPTGWPTVNL